MTHKVLKIDAAVHVGLIGRTLKREYSFEVCPVFAGVIF
jgi:hypothetical protein